LFYCKKIDASPEKSKWRHYARWRRKCLYLSPNISKNDIFDCFSLVFFIFWVKFNFYGNFFFLKIQNGGIIKYGG
jgi:hypothetical protein